MGITSFSFVRSRVQFYDSPSVRPHWAFWKGSWQQILLKSSPNVWQFFAYFETRHFLSKPRVATFWASLEEINLGNVTFQHLVTLLTSTTNYFGFYDRGVWRSSKRHTVHWLPLPKTTSKQPKKTRLSHVVQIRKAFGWPTNFYDVAHKAHRLITLNGCSTKTSLKRRNQNVVLKRRFYLTSYFNAVWSAISDIIRCKCRFVVFGLMLRTTCDIHTWFVTIT